MIEGLNKSVADRDTRIQQLQIELDSVSRRLSDIGTPTEMVPSAEDAAPLHDEIARLDAQLNEQIEVASQWQAEAQRVEAERDDLQARLNDAEADLAVLRADVERLQSAQGPAENGALAADLAELDAVRQEAASLRAHIGEAQAAAAQAQEKADEAREKFEEARAGRRNAEELAGLLRGRAEAAEAARAAAEARAAEFVPAPEAIAPAEDSEALAVAHAQLKAEKARAAETSEQLLKARQEADDVRTQLAAAQKRAEVAEAAQAAPAAEPVDADKLRAQVERLTATNRELEASASANMKRIQKLLRDAEEARNGADSGKADAAQTAVLQAQIVALQAEIAALQAQQGAAPSPELERLVEELNEVVSSFRNDFLTVTDAAEQLTSEDDNERAEAYSTLREGLEACTTRTTDLKNLVLALRKSVTRE